MCERPHWPRRLKTKLRRLRSSFTRQSGRTLNVQQWLTSSVLNARSPELWRQTAGEREFRVSAGVSQCGALRAKARVYWGFLRPDRSAENVWRGVTGGGTVAEGIITNNPVHGVRRPASNIRDRRLCDKEYRALGEILERAVQSGASSNAVSMILLLALTGCRRGEIINLCWDAVDEAKGCFRLRDTKEGSSIRPVGKAAFAVLSTIRGDRSRGYVFPSTIEGKQFVGFPKEWISIFKNSALSDITPHVLRHSFASTANDLGFSEPTIAAMLGHSRGTVTSRYVHHVDAVLVRAADVVASHISKTIRFQWSIDVENAAQTSRHGTQFSLGKNRSADEQPLTKAATAAAKPYAVAAE